jgi:hypothetical protein
MGTTIQLRRDTSQNWTSNNSILNEGEIGYETDTYRIKIGTGVGQWANLYHLAAPELNVDGGQADSLLDTSPTIVLNGGNSSIVRTGDKYTDLTGGTFVNGQTNRVGVFSDQLTLEGSSDFTWDGSTLSVNGNIQITNTAVATPYNIGSITDNLTINFNNGNHQYFTFSNTVANKTITLLAPTNTKNGLIGSIRIKKDVSPANATFTFAKEWYFDGGTVPDINGSLTFEQFGYLDYYVHASGEIRTSFSGPFANTTNI